MREWTGHVTEEWLKAWNLQQLSGAEEQMLLTHVGTCSFCADQFAACLEQDLTELPAYLHEEILERSKSLEIQAVKKVYQTSKQMRLFLYSLKVGVAVAVSLLLLFVSPIMEKNTIQLKKTYLESRTLTLTEKVDGVWQEFTGWLKDSGEKEDLYD